MSLFTFLVVGIIAMFLGAVFATCADFNATNFLRPILGATAGSVGVLTVATIAHFINVINGGHDMKHTTKSTTLLSERQFNAEARANAALPEHDSPGGTDVLDNYEILMGVNYWPDGPAEVIFNDDKPFSAEELAARAEETIS